MKKATFLPESLANHLDALAQRLPARAVDRLEHRRKQAIYHPEAALRQQGSLSLGRRWLHQHRIMAGSLLLALLLGGLSAYHRNADHQRPVGEVDAALLGGELPPGAFTNPQFVQWLQEHAQQ